MPLKNLFLLFLPVYFFSCSPTNHQPSKRILVFSKTSGYRHESIANGKAMFLEMAGQWQAVVDTTEDAGLFTVENLSRYKTVVFLNTTGDALNDKEQLALQHFIREGGGFLGIHAAADTEFEWPWYNQLVGAYFASHPKPQHLDYIVTESNHPAVKHWYPKTNRMEEIYDFKSVQKDMIKVIMLADEKTYDGGSMGDWHPAAWYHHFDGGKSFYTALGHLPETYADPAFRTHISGALEWLWQ